MFQENIARELIKELGFPAVMIHGRYRIFGSKAQQWLEEHYTPRHNGKVERSHRKDNEYFYADHKFYSFEDFKAQLKIHRYKYNRFPIRPLGWLSPNEYLAKYRNNTSASSV